MKNEELALVSVIIPSYNGARFLAESIESVLAQTYPHFEIIVVDDGSTDATKEVAACYSRVRYIHQENQGVSTARNRGYRESKGDYLIFLDYDDRLLPNALEINVEKFGFHSNCGCLAGRYKLIDSNGAPLHLALANEAENFRLSGTIDYKTLLSGYALASPSGSMFQRHAFESVNGFDPLFRYAEDLDLYLRIVRKFPIFRHDQVTFEYRRHDTNKTRDGQWAMERCLETLDRQWKYIEGNPEYESAYRIGKKRWRKFFYQTIPYDVATYLKKRKFDRASELFLLGLRHSPYSFAQYVFEYLSKRLGLQA